jgi:hypothetical protein
MANQRFRDGIVVNAGPVSLSRACRRADEITAIWTPEDVRLRLEEAGQTLMSLPLPGGSLPKDERSRWPDVVRGYEDAFAALIGASADLRHDFSDRYNQVRTVPSARAVGRLDEVLEWLWRFDDARKRRLCLARALIHPISGRHVVSYRKLGRIFGLHHETVRAWHSRALAEVAMALTRDQAPKTGPRQTRSRKPMRRQR